MGVSEGSDDRISHSAGKQAWLAQLVEHQSTVREVEGLSPRPEKHSGS